MYITDTHTVTWNVVGLYRTLSLKESKNGQTHLQDNDRIRCVRRAVEGNLQRSR
nr:MAG TPA: hypothetical protein [Caudoviricetes sp.]